MTKAFPIILAPNEIFRQKAKTVEKVDDEVKEIVARMFATLEVENAGDPSLYCAVIVKRVDEKTRSKTSINELLRAA